MIGRGTSDAGRGRERLIEDAIIAHPERLGYPGALAIRNWWVAPACGRVDVGLFPNDGVKRIVLVEAKAAAAPEAASRVVGQLLMYYAGALQLGSQGLSRLRTYAESDRNKACSPGPKTVRMLSGGMCPKEAAWAHFGAGERLLPDQVALFLALDDRPHRALQPTLSALKSHHGLSVGLVIVRGGTISEVDPQFAG